MSDHDLRDLDHDVDWAQIIQGHAERLAAGVSGPYDRYMVPLAGKWVEVTDQVHEAARQLGWTGA